MPITLVQSNSSGTNSGASTTLAFGSNTTAGNLLVAKVDCFASTISSFSSTGGNTFSNLSFQSTQTNWGNYIYYCLSCLGGAVSITATATSFALMTIEEYNPGAGFAFTGLDGTLVTGDSATGTAMTTSPIVTTNPNDLLLGIGLCFSTISSPGAGFTKIGTIGNGGTETGISEYRVVTVTGSYNVTATQNVSNAWSIAGLAFKAVTSGGGPSGSLIAAYDFWGGGFS